MRSRLRKAFVAAKLVRFRQPKARARQSVATAACASVSAALTATDVLIAPRALLLAIGYPRRDYL